MVFVPKVNDVSTMTSVRRMVSAIAGVILNHRFLKHIPSTGYLLPRKVLALACTSFATLRERKCSTISGPKEKRISVVAISTTTLFFFFPALFLRV